VSIHFPLIRNSLYCVLIFTLLVGCGPTYKRETMHESITELAKKEYKLDVEVKEVGETIGVQFRVKNMLGELVAEDQLLWEQMEDLMMVLSRIMLSSDDPPTFIVLDVVDEENPATHLIFTRYVQDIKKIMGVVLSRNQFLDRLLMEFVIGGKRTVFDPYDFDVVRLMMMAMDSFQEGKTLSEGVFGLEDVDFPGFLAKVAANSTRRFLRDKKPMKKRLVLRRVSAEYLWSRRGQGQFKILLDLVSKPGIKLAPTFLDDNVLPFVAEEAAKVFRSYKFTRFADIMVVEKNSGKMLLIPRK